MYSRTPDLNRIYPPNSIIKSAFDSCLQLARLAKTELCQLGFLRRPCQKDFPSREAAFNDAAQCAELELAVSHSPRAGERGLRYFPAAYRRARF